MVGVFFEQAAVFLAGHVALAQRLFVAEFIPRLGVAVGIDGDGEGRVVLRGAALALGEFRGGEAPLGLGDLQAVVGALDHDAAAARAEPLEVERVRHVLGRRLAALEHLAGFLDRDVEDAHLARGGDVARGAALL